MFINLLYTKELMGPNAGGVDHVVLQRRVLPKKSFIPCVRY